jgi:replicative DNA helicase
MQLRDEITESRLFGAIVAEPGVLAQCDDVETDDFSDLHLRFAFWALRNLQAGGKPTDILSIADELECKGYVQVDTARYAEALFDSPYCGEELLVQLDARWLRRLANRRRNA